MNREKDLRVFAKALADNSKLPYQTDLSYNEWEAELAEQIIDDIVEDAVLEGAQWADNHPRSPWVSTKKKLPKAINIEEVDDCGNIQWCACHTEKCHVSYFVGYYADSIDGEHKVWCDIAGQEVCGPYDVDYWMPIPAIPEEGGAK